MSNSSESVKVAVRCRPLNSKEFTLSQISTTIINKEHRTVTLRECRSGRNQQEFSFDYVFSNECGQSDVYNECCTHLVQSVLSGYNSTILAYGQTGSGKTYTCQGDINNQGIIQMVIEHIFTHIKNDTGYNFLVRLSYYEIYMEEIRDLLVKNQKKRLELREDVNTGTFIKGLTSVICQNLVEMLNIIKTGQKNRTVGVSNLNEHSSRSHSILSITVEKSIVETESKVFHVSVAKLCLVDLAGSERLSKHSNNNIKETVRINLSLSALRGVILSLSNKNRTHVPYRDSLLTRILQNSLGGNSKTLMIATIGPALSNYEETLSTLEYASLTKCITNRPCVVEDTKNALIMQFKNEIFKLRSQLEERSTNKKAIEHDDLIQTSKPDLFQFSYESEKETISDASTYFKENEILLNVIEEGAQKLREDKFKRERLAREIECLESKLFLEDGKTIIDKTQAQKEKLEKHQTDLFDQQEREKEVMQKIQVEIELLGDARQTYKDLRDETNMKKKKLKKLYSKFLSMKNNINETEEFYRNQREKLNNNIDSLIPELKFKMYLINNFVNPDISSHLFDSAIFDEAEGIWRLPPTDNSLSIDDIDKPFTLNSQTDSHICLPLRIPIRQSREYKFDQLSPGIRMALDTAFTETNDIINIDASSCLDVNN